MRKMVFICAAGLALATAGAALAEEAPRQKTVRFAETVLNEPAGAKAALDQLKVVAKEVCAEGFNSPHAFVITDRQCEGIALREAVYQAAHPGLSAAYAEDRARHNHRNRRAETLTAEHRQ